MANMITFFKGNRAPKHEAVSVTTGASSAGNSLIWEQIEIRVASINDNSKQPCFWLQMDRDTARRVAAQLQQYLNATKEPSSSEHCRSMRST